ncbi:hypothetical protein KIV40_24835, partial [Vibrio sp. D173a]|uniref:hypothetical protein n=1 Tax=Vibrio sp. D173a TaxID=2836349 RepID=UPI0025554410
DQHTLTSLFVCLNQFGLAPNSFFNECDVGFTVFHWSDRVISTNNLVEAKDKGKKLKYKIIIGYSLDNIMLSISSGN